MTIHIFGCGAMARAIGTALSQEYKVIYVVRNAPKDLDNFVFYEEIQNVTNLNIILCVKPHAYTQIAHFIKEADFILSPMALIDFKTLKSLAKADVYCRMMPNLGAKIGASITPYVFDEENQNPNKNQQIKNEILKILDLMGKKVTLSSEKELDLAMSFSGCAPAFLAIIAESFANSGLFLGLKNETSWELVRGLFESFAKTISDKNTHPAVLKENICSPAGVTIKGVKKLEQHGIRNAIFDAMIASANIQNN